MGYAAGRGQARGRRAAGMAAALGLATLAAWLAPSPAMAAGVECRRTEHAGNRYVLCTVDLAAADLRLFLARPDGTPFLTFDALADSLAAAGKRLVFAINGGMYDAAHRPAGLHVEDGRELEPLDTRVPTGPQAGIPNFYKQPNGVFYVSEGRAGVTTTAAYRASRPAARYATQSGPMLVIDGAINPIFIPGSRDRLPRDGVCVTGGTRVHFALSIGNVNFHAFATYFRDALGCRDALFLDGGTAPGIFAPELGRNDAPGHGGYGPIIAVVE